MVALSVPCKRSVSFSIGFIKGFKLQGTPTSTLVGQAPSLAAVTSQLLTGVIEELAWQGTHP